MWLSFTSLMGGFSKLQCFKRTYKRGNIFAVALLLLMIVGWEKPAGSKRFPLPLTMLKYFMRSEGCAMQTKHDVTALNELLLCAFFRVFSRFFAFLMKGDDDRRIPGSDSSWIPKRRENDGAFALKHSRSCSDNLISKVFPHLPSGS